MDLGTLLLMLAIATLTVAFILQPLFAKAKPERDELIAHWIKEISAADNSQDCDAVCPECGQAVRTSDRFCAACGARLKED